MEPGEERGKGKKEHRIEKGKLNIESLIGAKPAEVFMCVLVFVCQLASAAGKLSN